MHRFILKTDIKNIHQVNHLKTVFANQNQILRWSVDLDDVDKVLVVNANYSKQEELINLVRTQGIFCSELTDS